MTSEEQPIYNISITKSNLYPKEISESIILFIITNLPKFKVNKTQIDKNDIEGSYNNQLSMFLNANLSWEAFQFQHEYKRKNRRRPDVAVGITTEILESNYRSIFDIECKRLNTSMQSQHVKQYVSGETGGIERFKRNLHGTDLQSSAMIGYIENKTTDFWFKEINSWIEEKIDEDSEFWTEKEFLKKPNPKFYSSVHKRINAITNSIYIFHFFVMLRN